MSQLYRYTVYIDDSSKLSGYSQQAFIGGSSMLDGGVLHIRYDAHTYHRINWSRVRWYTCESLEGELGP